MMVRSNQQWHKRQRGSIVRVTNNIRERCIDGEEV